MIQTVSQQRIKKESAILTLLKIVDVEKRSHETIKFKIQIRSYFFFKVRSVAILKPQ